MAHTDPPPPRPLPPGAALYAVQDTTMIYVSQAEQGREPSRASYQRVSFDGSEHVVATANDRIDNLGSMADIRAARAVTHAASGRQDVVLLARTSLSIIGNFHGRDVDTSEPIDTSDDIVLIIGYDPLAPDNRLLALLLADGDGFAVKCWDMDRGTQTERTRLPKQVRGRALAAELVHRDLSTVLMIVTVDDTDNSLLVHSVAWADIRPQTEAKQVQTLKVGTIPQTGSWWPWPGKGGDYQTFTRRLVAPRSYYRNDAHRAIYEEYQLGAAVVRMRKGSTDQQLALAWPESAGSRIALIGWGADRRAADRALPDPPTVLANVAPQVEFAPPRWHVYRLAASDLTQAGTEQLVLGYPARYGKPGNREYGDRCVALMLFTLDEPEKSAAVLQCKSHYVVARDTDGAPWATYALHLAAGIFGTYKGVQVIGGSWFDGWQPHILCGFVPVDPVTGFPPLELGVPGVPKGYSSTRIGIRNRHAEERDARGYQFLDFFAFPSDLTGQSVVLGPPDFDQKSACAQIVAILQAHPYDRRVLANPPMVSLSKTDSQAEGATISAESSWNLSDDTSVNLGLGGLSRTVSTHVSQLKSQGRTHDTTSSNSVTVSPSFTSSDYVLVSEITYNVWRYPVLRGFAKNPAGGELLVVTPVSANPTTSWRQAHDYGFRPRSEVGMLFSYVNAQKDGYDPDHPDLLFALAGYDVAAKQDSTTLIYELSKNATGTQSAHLSIFNSVSEHFGLNLSTELFDYLPLSFGLGLNTSHSYSENKVDTTHVTIHSGLNLSFHSGTVKNILYEYHVTPVVYRHNKLGCLMLAWNVSLGDGWNRADASLTAPQPCLIRVVTDSNDIIYNQFSRSISFVENPDATMDLEVEIFNNGLVRARNVSCEFFDVSKEFKESSPKLPEDLKQLTLPEHSIGKVQLPAGFLEPLQRGKVKLSRQKLTKPAYVSVKLFMGDLGLGVYWGVFPPEKFFS